jgi:predicted RNA-binding protein YlxR (DUF448 family)
MLNNKKIPMRTCIGCNNKKSKKQMIRIIRTPEGKIEIDETGKKSGRGTYLCYNIECLNIAITKKQLNKSLKKDIPLQMYNELRRIFKKYISHRGGDRCENESI